MERKKAIAKQPISSLTWVKPEDLHANNYNPNTVFSPEMRLLKHSLIKEGWTQPLVVTQDNEIVDGFHRWNLSMEDSEVRAIAGGVIPVVYLGKITRGGQIMATVRHNRARGVHGVLKMAELVTELIDDICIEPGTVAQLLGMDSEEVSRLYDRGGMIERGSGEDFGQAWVPTKKKPADGAHRQ